MTKRAQTLLISLDCGCNMLNTLNVLICFLHANKPWCDQRSWWNHRGSSERNGRQTEPGESFRRPLDVTRRSKPDAILVTLSFFIVMREQRGAASAARTAEPALPRWCHQSHKPPAEQGEHRHINTLASKGTKPPQQTRCSNNLTWCFLNHPQILIDSLINERLTVEGSAGHNSVKYL